MFGSEGRPGQGEMKRRLAPASRAVFLHGADARPSDGDPFAVFEEKRSSAVAGVAFPTENSRSDAACGRALDIAAESFLERPSDSDLAVHMIGEFIDDSIAELQEPGREFMCSLAMLYIFKGKARLYPVGYSAVLFFEEGDLKEIVYGDGVPAGKGSHETMELTETLELDADCRFVFIAGQSEGSVREAAAYFKESKGEDAEGCEEYISGRHLAYVNLYLPKREKRGLLR